MRVVEKAEVRFCPECRQVMRKFTDGLDYWFECQVDGTRYGPAYLFN